jgi:hypothetical protein
MVIHDAATFPGLVLACRIIGILQIRQKSKGKAERNAVSGFLPWHLPFFPGLREPDRYCLLPAFDFATFSASAAFGRAPLVTSHLTFDVTAGGARIFPLSFLSH